MRGQESFQHPPGTHPFLFVSSRSPPLHGVVIVYLLVPGGSTKSRIATCMFDDSPIIFGMCLPHRDISPEA